MHDITLLVNIAVALALAFVGGWNARRFGLPTICWITGGRVTDFASGDVIGLIGEPDQLVAATTLLSPTAT